MALKINRTTRRVFRGIGIVLLIAIIAIIVKLLIWENNYYRTKTGQQRAIAEAPITRIVSAHNPSEQKPSKEEIEKYQVEREHPRYLNISRLGLHARITKSEVETNGILAAPDNIYDASWYAGSSKPGDGGCVILSGINSGKTADGIFANLDSLEPNDEIVIENGEGKEYKYQTKEIYVISDQSDSDANLARMQRKLDDKETLSLIAIKTGGVNNEFESLVMIRATLKE